MKSYFTRESKILAHNEKTALYSKLLQTVQQQQEKLQSRAEKLNELLKEATRCLAGLGPDADWEEWEAECSDEMAGRTDVSLTRVPHLTGQLYLCRELSDLEAENEQMLVRMSQLKEEEKYYRELLEKSEKNSRTRCGKNYSLGFIFLSFPDGDKFEDPSRRIISLDFVSLLNEEAAPPSSCLVHRLIFQFLASQGCWQEKCPMLCHLPQVLRDVSSVVSNCRLLGDEIEFLERWGGKFKLLKIDVSDTKVMLIFCSSAAFARFELTLSLSANYPNAPLPFTVRKVIGNIGEEEVSAVLSKVPVGLNYLRRIVSSVHQDLLWLST
ncbi:KNL1 protein, partial [Ramphastos sulfuratus]|nr:KNL1 protein [Ramphastos sulfuratus]